MYRPTLCLLLTASLLAAVPGARGAVVSMGPAELVSAADLVFEGVVTSATSRMNETGTLILTDYGFEVGRVIVDRTGRVGGSGAQLSLTLAGGQVGDLSLVVSDIPVLEIGDHVLLMAEDPDKAVLSPIVGGTQGVMRIIRDDLDGSDRVYSYSGRPVVDLGPETLRTATAVAPGSADEAANAKEAGLVSLTRLSSPPSSECEDELADCPRPSAEARATMTLDSFVEILVREVLPAAERLPTCEYGGRGDLMDDAGNILPLPRADLDPASPSPFESPLPGWGGADKEGQPAVYGYQPLPIVMEYPPTSYHGAFFYAGVFWSWNAILDMYDPDINDSSDGPNGDSEIVGFLDNAELRAMYGEGWPSGAIALCFYWRHGLFQYLVETDIVFNGTRNWTTLLNTALDTGRIAIRPVLMHEMGHSWGMMLQNEDYDYEVPTVMHAYHHGVVERGSVHAIDALLMRTVYGSPDNIVEMSDLGVQSYVADGGLISSRTNRMNYAPGDMLRIEDITVENVGTRSIFDPEIRVVLSSDREIDGTDTQIGSTSTWLKIPERTYTEFNLEKRIPAGMTPGTYYVGLIISLDGGARDDSPINDTTFLPQTIQVTCPALAAPTGLVATNDRVERIALDWNPVSGADGYEVERDGEVVTRCTASQWIDADLAVGTSYTYRVRAYNACRTGPRSSSATGQARPMTMTVWPGDLNGNGTVSAADVIALAMRWHDSGPSRESSGLAWRACEALPWSPPEATHADADGDGRVDMGDFLSICINWGRTTGKTTGEDEPPASLPVETLDRLREIRTSIPDDASGPEGEIRDYIDTVLGDGPQLVFEVHGNHPNPFNPRTSISFELPSTQRVTVSIHRIDGSRVTTLTDGVLGTGRHAIPWDGRDASGRPVASGAYFYRIVGETDARTGKMLLVK